MMTRCDAVALMQTLIGVFEQDVRGFAGDVLKEMSEGCAHIIDPMVGILLETSNPTMSVTRQYIRISFDLSSISNNVYIHFSDERFGPLDDIFLSLEELCDKSETSIDASLKIMKTLLNAQKTVIWCNFDHVGKPFLYPNPVMLFGGHITMNKISQMNDDDNSQMYHGPVTLSCTV